MALPRPLFTGEIEGKTIFDYMWIDKNIRDVEGRIEYVKDLLNVVEEDGVEFTDDRFLIDIWDKGVCKSEINTEDFLWSETNVAKALETLGSYILYADDEKKNRKDLDYKIYYDEKEFDKAIKKDETLLEERGEEIYNHNNGRSMKILLPRNNYKLSPKDEITKSDMFKHPMLKEYNDFVEYLKVLRDDEEIRKEFNEERGLNITESKLRKLIGFLNEDMRFVKQHFHQYLKPKHLLKDEGYPSWEKFDELDREHIKALLQVHRDMELIDFQNDVTCMVYDLSNILKNLKLTDSQQQILSMWQSCMTQNEIAVKLNKSQPYICITLNKVCDKIVKAYEEQYEDWYYLNVVKGEYQTCHRCGETKLIREFDRNGDNGRMTVCKKCRKEIRESKN